MDFGTCRGRKIEVDFTGGDITSDAGVLLLKIADKKINLTPRISKILNDPRVKKYCKHSVLSMLRQLVYGIGLGYEDLNDHDQLRNDKVIQTAVGSDKNLASSPTLCRFENWVDRKALVEMSKVLIQIFIESHKKPPEELILDFDGTDDKVHGNQVGGLYHGYYRHRCFLPLYVFCGNNLLVAYLRPGNVSDSKHSWAILKLLVGKLRSYWPDVAITFRGDGAFCRHKMFNWCERNNVGYIVGIPCNNRILDKAKDYLSEIEKLFIETKEKQKLFGEFTYSAKTWNKERRVIVKAECNEHRLNTRYIITNLVGESKMLYNKIYCARGEMENRIKEQQLCLFADRTSSKNWLTNQFRLLLSGTVYTLLEAIRRLALKKTELARSTCSTIRLKLLKIGAVVIRNTRKVRTLLSSTYPWQALFKLANQRLIKV
jgi:hypothetical protein